MMKLHKIDGFLKQIGVDAIKYIMNSRNMKEKNTNFKIVKVMKSTFKIILNPLFLSITFDDKY